MVFVNGEEKVVERSTRSRLVLLLGLAFGTCLLLFVVATSALTQITFERTYGGADFDAGRSVQQTLDGGYIIAGQTSSFGLGSVDVYLIKTDSLGQVVWDTTYGGSLSDWGFSVQQTFDGGYVIAGVTWSRGSGLADVYLIKTDSLGNAAWDTTYGGASDDWASSVQQTFDGGFVIVGYTESFGSGSADVYLIKTDSLGMVVWDTTYGGGSYDAGACVQQTTDGGYIIVGVTASFGAGEDDVYVIKTDSLGNTMWDTSYGGSFEDWGFSTHETFDGGYIIAGWTNSFGAGLYDVYLIKTDSLGNLIWGTTYGGTLHDWSNSVQQTLDSGYIVAGYTISFGDPEGDVYLIKTDENGLVGVYEQDQKTKTENRKLLQNQPNPFQGSTVISYSVSGYGAVSLQVYDLTGRLVETLVDEALGPGVYQSHWKAKDVPSGIYFYRLQAGNFGDTKKMILLR